jgi:hypothetical protein
MADLLFIVSRTEPKQYLYLKHVFADESRDVVLDRRIFADRRRSLSPQPVERRHIDRRHRDITRELQSSGWALVRRPVLYTDAASRVASWASSRAVA